MIEPAIPDDEQERLAALQELRILDTPAEERFDRITRTARDLFRVPIALISLVDARRQWFKSRTGLDASETPRSVSFCGHAILGTDPLVVEDALADLRFADNPLVTGDRAIRFYAGMPLCSLSGRKLGTLCLIDRVPRRFGADDEQRLRDLAAWAESELNLSAGIESALAEMRATFVRLVNHELRTPVTSIVGALELIRGSIAAGDDVETLTGIAIDGARQINRVVDDILEIAELDAWQQDLTPIDIELPLFIDAAIEFYVATARPVRATITVEAPQGTFVRAVPKPLDRILRSLVDNAQRFSPPDTDIVIAVAVTECNMIRISVTDRGPGIPAEHIPRLFQPFHQVDATDRRSHSGFGVSLAICHRLATAMGGRLGYEPVAGGGSRFFLDLPT
ncbi:MAG: GAF domain-containing sensor histidine kinase [Sulfuritalea sp.]|jgi:signal transduction histidine kinase|nr:GAF domain-containing sensor histidine kinase [Sulfuritalea sp.]